MAFKKGQTTNPAGRPQGAVNKSTAQIKQAFLMLIDNNIDNITLWLEEVAEKNPEAALKILLQDLTKWVLPTMTQQAISADIKQRNADLTNIEDEDVKFLYDKYIKKDDSTDNP